MLHTSLNQDIFIDGLRCRIMDFAYINGRPPSIIVMHPTLYTIFDNITVAHCYVSMDNIRGTKRFMGIRTIRSNDVKKGNLEIY